MMSPSISSPSYVAVARRRKVYRGGFHSSICDLFSDPSRRADCCALACCGILQSDKNRYLLNGERPSWWERIAINCGIPLAALIIMIVVGALVTPKNEDFQKAYFWCTILTFFAIVAAICIRGRLIRMRLRREIMKRMHEKRGGDAVERAVYLSTYEKDICCSQMTCCGCYSNDVTFAIDDSDEEPEDGPQPDFCTRIFQNIGSLCCFACCQCWCQCCGMCAIGQEEREISALVPKHRQLIDYMTFEVSVSKCGKGETMSSTVLHLSCSRSSLTIQESSSFARMRSIAFGRT